MLPTSEMHSRLIGIFLYSQRPIHRIVLYAVDSIFFSFAGDGMCADGTLCFGTHEREENNKNKRQKKVVIRKASKACVSVVKHVGVFGLLKRATLHFEHPCRHGRSNQRT